MHTGMNVTGRRFVQPAGYTSIIAAGAPGQQNIHVLSTGRSRARIKKMVVYHSAGCLLTIGETPPAGVFTQRLPLLPVLAGVLNIFTEDDLPAFEFRGNIQAQASVAAAAPNDVQVTIEVEEI